jgi:2-phospho-L-lactate guanylyltransferase
VPTPALPPDPAWIGERVVLVPVKRFSEAKGRLAPALSPARRAELAASMARHVIRSAGDLPVAVVCDDREVAVFARDLGALVLWEPGRGLNGAVQEGVRLLGRAGARLVVVAAGDLPLADDLAWVTRYDGITLVPDRGHDGTNVMGIPADGRFEPSYGPGSFARHLAQARALGMPVRVVNAPLLAWDVDFPADLAAIRG